MKTCLYCGAPVKSKFCNNSCSAKFNNSKRPKRSLESRKKTSETLSGRVLSDTHKENIAKAMAGRDVPWVTGKPVSDETKAKIASSLRGREVSQATRDKLSKAAIKRGLGGHTSKTKLYYKTKDGSEIYLQSSYEIKFATILDELNIEWSRPDPLNWIDDAGKSHRYYPDFKIGNIYIDTKNDFLAKKDLPKIESVKRQNNIDLRIVTKDMINHTFVASLSNM